MELDVKVSGIYSSFPAKSREQDPWKTRVVESLARSKIERTYMRVDDRLSRVEILHVRDYRRRRELGRGTRGEHAAVKLTASPRGILQTGWQARVNLHAAVLDMHLTKEA